MIGAEQPPLTAERFLKHARQLQACADALTVAGDLLQDFPDDRDALKAADQVYAASVALMGRLASDLTALRHA